MIALKSRSRDSLVSRQNPWGEATAMKPFPLPARPGLKYILAVIALCSVVLLSCKLDASGIKQWRQATDTPPCLENFVLGKDRKIITLSLQVGNPFDQKLKTLILDGVPQKITLKTWTAEKKNYLFVVNFNRLIRKNVITHKIKYDNLKKLFVVTGNDLENIYETPAYEQALRRASRFTGVPLLSLVQARPQARYQVKVRAEIRKTRLPFHLEYFFFFLSAWDRKTRTYTLEIPDHFLPPPGSLKAADER